MSLMCYNTKILRFLRFVGSCNLRSHRHSEISTFDDPKGSKKNAFRTGSFSWEPP